LEITFVRIPLEDVTLEQSTWAEADEQCIDAECRRRLNDNGLRCGTISGPLPAQLRQLLTSTDSATQEPPMGEISLKAVHTHWISGARVPIIATTRQEDMIVFHKDGPGYGEHVSGKTYQDAQGIIAGTACAQGDGSVRIELVPEIHFGQPRNQFVAADGAIQLRTERNREAFPDLLVETRLSPGQTLLLGGTRELKGFGSVLFVDRDDGVPSRKLLLLRVTGTQRDELFDR
jgi:hypothetical protein